MKRKLAFVTEARRAFHAALLEHVLKTDASGVPTNADKNSVPSITIARGILERLGSSATGTRLAGQLAGADFEKICAAYLTEVFPKLQHLRPGTWEVARGMGGGRLAIAQFDQYDHLSVLDKAAQENPAIAVALGADYLIKPDVITVRYPEEDSKINSSGLLVDSGAANFTSLRKANNSKPILHASISCKWTIRSDRAQNSRSEALNLIRNRKGRLPHIAVVTGEPIPNRIASIALGTGDIDCVYHFALPELRETLKECGYEDAQDLLATMIEGKRLRDIADLPFDLVI